MSILFPYPFSQLLLCSEEVCNYRNDSCRIVSVSETCIFSLLEPCNPFRWIFLSCQPHEKSCHCLQPGNSVIAATAQALQRRFCMCFHPFPYHSQSTFLEIKSGTCWWMQVLFRNMTTCHHPVSCYQATAGNICLAWNIFCTVLPSKVCVPFPPPAKRTVFAGFGSGSSSF